MPRELRPLEYPQEYVFGEIIPLADRLIAENLVPYVYDVMYTQTTTTADVEMQTGCTTELIVANSGSYTKVDIVSASTDDKSATSGDTQAVKMWGVDRYYNFRVEQMALSGTTAISSTNSYRACNSAYGVLFEDASATTQDAKGNIDIGMTKKVSAEDLRIAAGNRMTTSARVWIPKNWRIKIDKLQAYPGFATNTSAGILIHPTYYTDDQDRGDDTVDYYAGYRDNPPRVEGNDLSRVYGDDSTISKLTLYGKGLNAYGAWNIRARYIMWATKAVDKTGSSQSKYIQGDLT